MRLLAMHSRHKKRPSRKKKVKKQIPNIVSISRIALTAAMIVSAAYNLKTAVIAILIIALLTDMLDGLAARLLKAKSNFGAKLDSIADYILFLALIPAIYLVKPEAIAKNLNVVLTMAGFLILEIATGLLIHKKFITFHYHSSKLYNILLSPFAVYTLVYSFNRIFFGIVYVIMAISTLEDISTQLTCKKPEQKRISYFYKLKKAELKGKAIRVLAINGLLAGTAAYIFATWLTGAEIRSVILGYGLIGMAAGVLAGLAVERFLLRES